MIVENNFHLKLLIFINRSICITYLISRLSTLLLASLFVLLIHAFELIVLFILFIFFIHLLLMAIKTLLVIYFLQTLAMLIEHCWRGIFHHRAITVRLAICLVGSYFLVFHLVKM